MLFPVRRVALLFIALCACVAHADTIFLKAGIDAAPAGTASNADGSALFSYDTATRLLTWTVNYRKLSGPVTGAHLHGPAAPGASAPIAVPITTSASPMAGSATLGAAQETDMLAGLWSVDVHTDNFAGGEIRGRLARVETNFYDVFAGTAGVSSASLRGTVTLDPATLRMTWSIYWGAPLLNRGLSSHFNGPARQSETAPATLATTLAMPITGSATLTAAQAAALVTGYWYFQVDEFSFSPRAQVLASHPRLSNISTRGKVLNGNDVMIGGFVIGGSANKTVAVVATGPSLSAAGVSNPLANPTLMLVRSSDRSVIATNDDWQNGSSSTEIGFSGLRPPDLLEAAIYANLPPGAYTAIVSGAGGGTGVAVIAVYEIAPQEGPLINISTRGNVLTGDDVLIGGFVIQGNSPQKVAIVATGPSLAAFGIANPLADPTLSIVRSTDQAVIATNDNWQTDANAAQLQAAGFAPPNALESAILVTLNPGAYTAIVAGAGGGTGTAVVGVYAVP